MLKLTFSEKFINILKTTDSKISKELIKLSGLKKEYPENFISSSDKNDEVTFISNKKISEVIGDVPRQEYIITRTSAILRNVESNHEIFKNLGYTPTENVSILNGEVGYVKKTTIFKIADISRQYCLFSTKNGDCVVCTSYLMRSNDPELILEKTKEKLWVSNRVSIKIGRLVRSIMTKNSIEFVEKDIEDFVNQYKSSFDVSINAMANFKIVTGKEISYWYNEKNYESQGSTLGNSCMKDVPPSYFDLYTKNSNCSLLILYSNQFRNFKFVKDSEGVPKFESKKICGRALVWKTDEGDTVMDRIYTNRDSDISLFKKFAQERGWIYKTSQDSYYHSQLTDGKTFFTKKYSISLDEVEFEKYPYLDTMQFIYKWDKKISNRDTIYLNGRSIISNGILTSTKGSIESYYV